MSTLFYAKLIYVEHCSELCNPPPQYYEMFHVNECVLVFFFFKLLCTIPLWGWAIAYITNLYLCC